MANDNWHPTRGHTLFLVVSDGGEKDEGLHKVSFTG